jgi:AcrR family transcriptional regulator
MSRMPTADRRPGRPRHRPATASATGREQILDAAAELFVAHGVAATSTRMIAERVGVRQASLYYHFNGKDEILAELLSASVRPSLQAFQQIAAAGTEPAAALYALALIDVRTLATNPHNIGTLYLLPELQGEGFDAFRAERRELRDAYGRLGVAAASPEVATLGEERLGDLLIQLAEVTIHLRRHRSLTDEDATAVADSSLRLCGLDEAALARARTRARTLALTNPEEPRLAWPGVSTNVQ